MRYVVPLTTAANIAVTVETDETDPEKIAELAIEQAEQAMPELCRQCSDTVELGDDYRPVRMNDDSVPTVTKLEGSRDA
ncbi:hypothetical protein [Streptomyces nanshensis]|uniref:Uncharacterized protein n=1 Tax=Streptomyces nanshensis TaxID=518642 RepID=A0A1E7L568_9ACTN|nr:hypothetical protein [Streptomyces nanshensis]OEV11332.1 hypothetical protein AN218_13345 [Streptomyces nanshensis]